MCAKGKVNATGSEYLSLLPVLALYLIRYVKPKGILEPNVKSMVLCIECVELLQNCYDIDSGVTPPLLQDALDRYMPAHEAVHGDSLKIPKTHHAWAHFPDMLEDFKFLIPTFTHERKHKLVKQFADRRHGQQSYGRGIMEDLTLCQFRNLNDSLERSSMIDPIDAPKRVTDELVRDGIAFVNSTIKTSLSFVSFGRTVCKNDVVLLAFPTVPGGSIYSVGKIIFCCSVDGAVWVCVQMWDVVEAVINVVYVILHVAFLT